MPPELGVQRLRDGLRHMNNPVKILFSQGTLLNRLLRKYAAFILLLTTLATFLIAGNTYLQNRNQARMTLQEAIQSTTRMVNDKRSSSRLILNQLSGSFDKMENITAYLTKPTDEYFSYIYTHQRESRDFFLFPDELRTVFANYDDLSSLYISLTQFPEYLESTVQDKAGMVKTGTPTLLEDAFYIMMPIIQGSVDGSMFIGFKESDFETSLQNLNSFDGLSVYVISGTSNRLYTYHDTNLRSEKSEAQEQALFNKLQENSQLPLQELREEYFTATQGIGGEYRILATIDRMAVLKQSLVSMLPLFAGVALLNTVLLTVLFRTFKRYAEQVESVTVAMDRASAGNLETRIDTQKTEYELRDLSEGINHMLDSIEKYIDDIYKLEIKQQEAHMRALQAQINPHFLYNTLEYIRMYALSEGSEELADVVYAFSTLLRNNISTEKVTTLEEELEFCEKYVYLYQMRYPNRIAYHFVISEELKNLSIPKFVIQPLVENYFKHGIDFTRKDNVVSVKAYQTDEAVTIEVSDNGKGISEERLSEIRAKLKIARVQMDESIGLQNVNERMHGFYGERYQMHLFQNDMGGVSVVLLIKKESSRV